MIACQFEIGDFVPFVTTRPFSHRNNLISRGCEKWANYRNILVTWQKYGGIVCLLWPLNSEKKKYLYAEELSANDFRWISDALITRLFLCENGRVVTNGLYPQFGRKPPVEFRVLFPIEKWQQILSKKNINLKVLFLDIFHFMII